MAYTVKAVADLAGVSIRTLHHYDEIGLLKPASVSHSGYRQYTDTDLERLQQILFFRELGFGLQEIRDIVDNPSFDKKQALVSHKQLLLEKQRRLQALIHSVDQSIEALERGTRMNKDTMFEGFDESRLEEYRQEARARWGHTDAWKQSQERTAQYTQQDWDEIKAEAKDIQDRIAALMDQEPGDPRVQEQIGRWFRHINDRFYTVPPAMFRGLGDMYVNDPRFTANYEKVKPGMAQFMQQAMHVYADGLEANR